MAAPANDDSIQMQIEGVRKIAEEALMSTQHLAKDYNANQVTISQWNGNTTQGEFWAAYQELTESEFFDELVKSGELVLVNDKKPMEVTLTLFKASRCHSCMQQIVQIIYDYNLPLRCTHTVPTGKRNLMRTARVAFREYAKEIQGDPKVLIKTKFPNSFEDPDWQHVYEDGENKVVLAKGEAGEVNNTRIMMVTLAGVAQLKDQTLWSMAERAEAGKKELEEITGYPLHMDIEIAGHNIEPLSDKDNKHKGAATSKGEDAKNGKAGKRKSKGKGKAGNGKGSKGKGKK